VLHMCAPHRVSPINPQASTGHVWCAPHVFDIVRMVCAMSTQAQNALSMPPHRARMALLGCFVLCVASECAEYGEFSMLLPYGACGRRPMS
jgi:hypothetical protein